MFRLDRYEEKIKNNREKIIPSDLIPPQLNMKTDQLGKKWKILKTDQLGKKWKLMQTDQLGMKWKLMKADQLGKKWKLMKTASSWVPLK